MRDDSKKAKYTHVKYKAFTHEKFDAYKQSIMYILIYEDCIYKQHA